MTDGPRVGIIGAGFSGIIAAVKLRDVGINNITIFERADACGGVWRQKYPGVSVDVPSHLYSFSFMRRYDWPQSHATAEQLRTYLEHVIAEFGLAKSIRYRCSVDQVIWDIE